MKGKIVSLALLFAAAGACAQSSTALRATGYIKDKTTFYQVTGCRPATPVEVYSHSSGGKLVASGTADARGMALLEIPAKATAAFVINRTAPSKAGEPGAGYVAKLQRPVLELRSFAVQHNGNPVLRWEVISQQPGITCGVYRSEGNAGFKKIATLPAAQHTGGAYTYTDQEIHDIAGSGVEYEVQVTDASGKLSLTLGTQRLNGGNGNTVKVYPSVCTDHFNVQLPPGAVGTVQVFSNAGVLVHSVSAKPGLNTVSVTRLAAAGYLVKVVGRDNSILYKGRVVKSN